MGERGRKKLNVFVIYKKIILESFGEQCAHWAHNTLTLACEWIYRKIGNNSNYKEKSVFLMSIQPGSVICAHFVMHNEVSIKCKLIIWLISLLNFNNLIFLYIVECFFITRCRHVLLNLNGEIDEYLRLLTKGINKILFSFHIKSHNNINFIKILFKIHRLFPICVPLNKSFVICHEFKIPFL